jgi:hypothetical protein
VFAVQKAKEYAMKVIIKINLLSLASQSTKSHQYGGRERIIFPCLEVKPSPSIAASSG